MLLVWFGDAAYLGVIVFLEFVLVEFVLVELVFLDFVLVELVVGLLLVGPRCCVGVHVTDSGTASAVRIAPSSGGLSSATVVGMAVANGGTDVSVIW